MVRYIDACECVPVSVGAAAQGEATVVSVILWTVMIFCTSGKHVLSAVPQPSSAAWSVLAATTS